MIKIPSKIRIGGQLLIISHEDKIEGSKLGTCCLANGLIKIAKTFDGMDQSDSSKMNTFLHEATHAILDTMGRNDLSSDEAFVSTFAGFLTEMVYSMEFEEEKV